MPGRRINDRQSEGDRLISVKEESIRKEIEGGINDNVRHELTSAEVQPVSWEQVVILPCNFKRYYF